MNGIDDLEFHYLVRQKPQGPSLAPLRWLGARQRRQSRLLFTVENRLDGWRLALLASENGVKSLLDQPAAHLIDHADIGLPRVGNPFIRPTFAQGTRIRLQQNPRLQHGARRRLALVGQVLKMVPFFRRQIDYISLL